MIVNTNKIDKININDELIIIGIGKIKIISISKIKKIRVILKNRMENGIRPVEKVLNPHSIGDINSLFINLIFETNKNIKKIVKMSSSLKQKNFIILF